MSTPFIKWVGGKTQIIDVIMKEFQKSDINNYYEPFLGGGSVLLKLLELMDKKEINISGNIYASDINKNLINAYIQIKDNKDELMKEMDNIKSVFNKAKEVKYKVRHKFIIKGKSVEQLITEGKKALYYYYRDEYNKIKNTDSHLIRAAALFIFLNKTCFRGLYRESKNGFNTPYGNYKNPTIYIKPNIDRISLLLNKYNVNFTAIDFNKIEFKYEQNDLVYFDPPYYPVNDTSFTSYSSEGFDKDSHNNLLKLCNKLNDRKVRFIHSNSDTNFNNNNYKEYEIQKIDCKRLINSKNPTSKIKELIVTNRNLIIFSC